jgi:hypothetical protein
MNGRTEKEKEEEEEDCIDAVFHIHPPNFGGDIFTAVV